MHTYKKRNDKIQIDDVGKIFIIHNGRSSIKFKINVNMVDHKFGEFVQTRTVKRKLKKNQQKKR